MTIVFCVCLFSTDYALELQYVALGVVSERWCRVWARRRLATPCDHALFTMKRSLYTGMIF